RFWGLLQTLFDASWRFQSRDPVLPPRTPWDIFQLLTALRPDTLVTVPFALMTVADALKLCGVGQDERLRRFLDLQLKLYSQVGADETALLYAATALAVSQEPQGLFHLQGSMQVLSDRLTDSLREHGGTLQTRHRVEAITTENGSATGLQVHNLKTKATHFEPGEIVITNLTAPNLGQLLTTAEGTHPWQGLTLDLYRRRMDKQLPEASGAFVIYLGVKRDALPDDCPPHLQFLYNPEGPIGENNSLFVSVSKPGDGRAPDGHATLIASSFTDVENWWLCDETGYQERKQFYTDSAIAKLNSYFTLNSDTILHTEAATPRTFAHYTARDRGIVGGVGQRLSTFGPFGIPTRSPIPNLWLTGDSTHPGEGTAGVSYSAWTVVRQIMTAYGK
ncbi:MAG: FAD-dependent oxidoreductase, partial [Cyanobacteria bacterium P01_H01_bin.15]